MASQENPQPTIPSDDPNVLVKQLLAVVECLHKELRSESSNNLFDEFSLYHPHFGPTRPYEGGLFLRLHNDLQQLKEWLCKLQYLHADVYDELWKHVHPLDVLLRKVASSQFSSENSNWMKSGVEGITRKISDLAGKLPPLPDKLVRRKILYSSDGDGDNNGKEIKELLGLQETADEFTKFRQVKQKFKELEIERKICLLSFAVFPENREVHRTMLMYWWIGEGIIPVEGAEETVKEVLKEFTENKLVEPIEKRRKVAPSSYKMNPFVHSSVIRLSQDIGLFDIYRKGQRPMMNDSEIRKVCLVEGLANKAHLEMPPLDQIETVFNVSERYPDFTFKWFSEHSSNKKLIKLFRNVFKSFRVLYLGRWERTQKRQIQVQNPELMKCLKDMKNLRVVSFQGISLIRSLKSSICKLHKLIVLDLRECSDLTKLPEEIGSLRSLVYLDMTGCYMLEWIPMRLALLKNLEVLKGFVVSDTMYEGDACNLNYLKILKKLRKLSIEIHRDDLGIEQLMVDLVKLKALTSLKVTWRRDLNIIRAGKSQDLTKIESLPHKLRKLDLQHFPDDELPTWLHPRNLLHLKKLHIGRSRTLKGLGDLPEKTTSCAVEVLRLTSLPRLRIGWIELKQIYFPNLRLLENYGCPRVSLSPCDGNGIWRSDQDSGPKAPEQSHLIG